MKISVADLFVIADTIRNSLRVSNYGGAFSSETRTLVMNKVLDIMSEIEVEVITDKPNPETLTADSGF